MKTRISRIIIIAFLCLVSIWMIICKDINFSDKENRYLAQNPKFSPASVMSGKFMSDMEKYMSDQFPLRNSCITLKTSVMKMMGMKKVNGVYLGKSGYLIAGEEKFEKDETEKLVAGINSFAANTNAKVSMMLVPNAISICEKYLPAGIKSSQREVVNSIEEMLSEKINNVDVFSVLEEHNDEQLFYKTDHHWTTEAARYAFMEYGKTMGLDIKKNDFRKYCVAGDFQGTQASNAGVYNLCDNLNIIVPREDKVTYTVSNMEKMEKSATLFDSSKLKEKDKYLVFMGGNYSEVGIETTAKTGKNLLLIKDSFANCMIPMLTPYYDNIIVIDPRYYCDNLNDLVKDNSITEVLFMYNVNSFITDNSLNDILKIKK